MGLLTCIASSDLDLTTTVAVKRVLGATADTSDDSYISSLVRRASRWAEAYVGYPLSAQAYRESVASMGERQVLLSRTPIRSVLSVWDSTSTDSATTILSSDFRLLGHGALDRDEGWAWSASLVPPPFAVPLSDSPWPGQERPEWLVDYVAGYVYGGLSTDSDLWSTEKGTTSTERTLPEDIEEAVVLKAVRWYEGVEGVTAKSVGDLRIQYGSVRGGGVVADDPAESLLRPYRRVV